MKQIRNFAEANEALAQFLPNTRVVGSYSLDKPKALMDYLGNPQNQLKVIHVAGTSGKTSTSYYAAALLAATGKKVGLTVSPHIAEINERVQINLLPMPEAEFCKELSEFLALIETSQINPSWFEFLIAFDYWEFAKQAADYAVVEVGLGGLLDGTNVIDRADKVCIITDIGLDHVRVLGHSLPEIAAQKAGIIQPRNVVFSYSQAANITDIIKNQAEQMQAELHLIEPSLMPPASLSFLPLFQQRNFGLAKQAVDYVIKRDGIAPLSPRQVLVAAKTHIPARMEIFKYKDKTIILDGAHNAQKLHALVASIKAKFPDQPVAAIVSFSVLNADSRLHDGLQELSHLVDYVITTEFGINQDVHQQSVDTEAVVQACRDIGMHGVEVVKEPIEALKTLLSRPENILLVTGSFYLLNPIRPYVLELEK
jgi:dihydrofolate synthase/folylpolyglutamate synthase